MNNTVRIVIAIVVGVILLAGIVFSVFVQDETTILMLALLFVMYILYLVRLRSVLKRKNVKKTPDSPLARRR